MVEYGILGPLTARVEGQPVDLGGARTRAVLAVLLLDRNAVVSVDRLVDLVWGDAPPPTAETALQGHISRLRRLLGAAAIETRPPGYVLRVGAGEVDVERFEALVLRARAAAPREAGELLREALGLWRGPALADLAYEPFAEVEIARLEELRLGALEARIEADLAAGRHEALAGELEALVAEHPYRERLHGQRILALYRSGRQAEALAAYRAARTALDEGLGIDPGPELQALEVRILQQDPTLAAPAAEVAAPPTNIPAPSTPLIGRHTELADLRALLHGATRLVTLTGPGGTGKTRLALELAHVLAGEDAGGTWFVDLSSSTEVWQAISAIQGALGVPDAAGDDPLEPLRGFLQPRRLFLLLDNLEQILGIAVPIAALLAAAPGLRIAATSRAPLRIGGEQEYPLAPLPSGAAGEAIDVDAPPDAVALFVARARIGVPGFTLTSATADTVAELCRRLDGLPLAIELAASRVRLLSPAAILERLAAGLDILRAERRDLPARQRTLEAAIDWSYRLLDEPAQRAFRRCATFAGGFTLPAFEAVCVEPDDDPLEVLGALVEHSLVTRRQADEADEPHFGMLETIHQFAEHRLDDSPESDAVRERHMRFFLGLAEAATSALDGPEEGAWMPILRDSHDNLRTALAWLAAVDRRDELVELVSVLSRFWVLDSHYLEGRRWITSALALEGAGSLRARATALRNLSAIADTLGDARAALGFASESVRLWEAVGDVHGLADALRVESMVLNDLGDLDGARHAASLALGHAQAIGDERTIRGARHELAYLAVQANDLGSALALLEENAEAMRLADDRLGLATTLGNVGEIQRMLGAHGPAEGSARQAIAILRTLGDDASLGSVLTTLGAILVGVGRLGEARAALVEALAIAWRAGALHELPEMLDLLGDLWRRNGDAFRAVELYAAASVLRDASGSGLSANSLDAALADARRDLASASSGQAWRSGSTTPLDRLVEDELRRRPLSVQANHHPDRADE